MSLMTLLIISALLAVGAIVLIFIDKSNEIQDSEIHLSKDAIEEPVVGGLQVSSHRDIDNVRYVHISDRSRYFSILRQLISTASERIIIVDYVNHGWQMNIDDFNGGKSALNNYYQEYFDFVTSIFRERSLKYIRILCLPQMGDSASSIEPEEVLMQAAIQLLYHPTRTHILNVIEDDNFELYVQADSRRLFSSIFVDDKAWAIEIDEYNGNKCRPDSMILNSSYSLGTELIRNEIDETLRDISGLSRITRGDIQRFLKILFDLKEIQLSEEHEKMSKAEKSIHEIKETLELVKVAAGDFV